MPVKPVSVILREQQQTQLMLMCSEVANFHVVTLEHSRMVVSIQSAKQTCCVSAALPDVLQRHYVLILSVCVCVRMGVSVQVFYD